MNYTLAEISSRDKSWDNKKVYAGKIAENYRDQGYLKYADRMDECAKTLEFAKITDQETGEVKLKLASARFCRVRQCPVCQWRRSLKWCGKFLEASPKIEEEFKDYKWIFLTATVRNCKVEELRETIGYMHKSFVRLRKLKEFPSEGWIKGTEITLNERTGEAHPHFHLIMIVQPNYFSGRKYLSQPQWRIIWQKSLRSNYLPIINVKAIKNIANNHQTLKYAVKYSTKESEIEGEKLVEITRQLHRTKGISIGGNLRNFIKPESKEEDLIKVSNLEEESGSSESVYFRWDDKYRIVNWQ